MPGTLTWKKIDEDDKLLDDAQWKLTAPGHPGGTIVADCMSGTCKGLIDQDPTPAKFKVTGLKWGNYSLVETGAPEGYARPKDALHFPKIEPGTLEQTLADVEGKVVDGGVVNKPLVGTVTWKKADEDNGELLGGSEWTLSGTDVPAGTVVTDCVEAGRCGTGK